MTGQATTETMMHPVAKCGCDVATIVSVIENSNILIAGGAERLPAGYEQVDVAILHWIATQRPRSRPGSYLPN